MILRRFIAIALALGLCSLANTAPAAEKVRLAVSSTSLFYASAYVAKEMGYFKNQGLDATIIDVGSGSNVIASVVGGSAEFGAGSVLNISHGVAKGQDLKGFARSILGFPNFVVTQKGQMATAGLKPNSPFAQRLAILKGKTVAVNDIGGSAGDFVRGLLKRANIDEKSVTMINMSSAPGRLAALKAKKVDALVGYPPEPEAAIVGGYGEILVDSARDMPDVKSIEYILYFSSGAYITEKPDVVKAFARAVAEASKLINENPDRAREAYFAQMSAKAAGGKIDPKLAKLQWEHMLPYYTQDVAIGTDSLAGARQFFRVPATVSDEALVDLTIAPKN